MRVIDPDAHFFEPLDWLDYADPELAAQLPPPRRFSQILIRRAGEGGLPGREAPDDPIEFIPQEIRLHLEKGEALQADHLTEATEEQRPYFDADERIEVCDAEGIDIQLVNPTAGPVTLSYQIQESGHPELTQRGIGTYNRWALDQLDGHLDRLLPVAQIDPSDVEWSIGEMTRMREAGSRAFHLTRPRNKSYSHPDFEPLWSAAEDLGMAPYVHIQFGTPVDPTLANNGRSLETFVHLGGIGEAAFTRQFLMTLVFDGVFERHPRLRMILAECGHSWFLPFLFDIDAKTSKIAMDGQVHESFYKLPLKPSEYLARQVRISALPGYIAAGQESVSVKDMLEQLPDPDMFVFSSDYPHLEGRQAAVPFFEELLPDDERVRERFFGASMADFLAV